MPQWPIFYVLIAAQNVAVTPVGGVRGCTHREIWVRSVLPCAGVSMGRVSRSQSGIPEKSLPACCTAAEHRLSTQLNAVRKRLLAEILFTTGKSKHLQHRREKRWETGGYWVKEKRDSLYLQIQEGKTLLFLLCYFWQLKYVTALSWTVWKTLPCSKILCENF